jgi:cell wall-associated NlpC family hydrolase
MQLQFYKYFLVVLLMFCASSFGQKVIKHKVKSGESIYSIAKKYDVTEKEIYELNPNLKGKVLALKTEVKINNKKYKEEEQKPKEVKKEIVVSTPKVNTNSNLNEPYVTHLVEAKETLYSISKQYGVTMEEICEINPELKTGNLKKGARLKIQNRKFIPDSTEEVKIEPKPIVEETPIDEFSTSKYVLHRVQPKETLFKISRDYGVSVSELQRLNPKIKSSLPVGFDLIIKKGKSQFEGAPKTTIETTQEVVEVQPVSYENMAKTDILVVKSSQFIGTRYRTGGTTTSGFDCSGLMCTTFKEIDFALPRTSKEQSNFGYTIDRAQAQKGDLIFFTTNGRGYINHVGMVTEVSGDEIKFIHASIQSGVIISSTNEEYYAKRFVKVNRVLNEAIK